jgi:prepilin-type processing-associated H-X9-DG protein
MNAFLGMKSGDIAKDSLGHGPVLKLSDITRSKDQVFFFAEENMWLRPGCSWVLNDNALCGDSRDWFATFHSTSSGKLNSGTSNAVFVDAHVEEVRSALKDDVNDKSEMEFGRFEKYAWPHREPFQQ